MSEILKLNSKLDEHLKAIKGGANWFYWIAGLSIINTLIIFFNGDVNFIVGLGLTQIVDAIFYDSPNAFKILGLFVNLMIAGIFAIIGFFANKKSKTAFIIGIILYLIDGLLFLYVQDYLGVGFHTFVLFMIVGGFGNIKLAEEVESKIRKIEEESLIEQNKSAEN